MARARVRPFVLAVVAATAVVSMLFLAGLGSQKLFEKKSPLRPRNGLQASRILFPKTDPTRFRVTGIQGGVECVQDGRTYALQPGDLLSFQDVIRTAAHARVLIRRGGSEIEVRENLEVRVEALAQQTAKFSVLSGDGGLSASVAGSDETLAIAADATESVNMGPSRWVVARTQSGKVAVVVAKGQVKFKAQGAAVTVNAGTESVATPGQPPTPPQAFPDDLLLSVIWPESPPTKGTAQIQGTARPSSHVVINGRRVEVNADGTFSAEVPLRLGANAIRVLERDVEGRHKAVTGNVRRVPSTPTLEVQKEDLWATP